MPIIAPQAPPIGTGPVFLVVSGHSVAKIGNAVMPNGQGVMAYLDLNDRINTTLNITTDLGSGRAGFTIDDSNRQLELAQLLYRGRSIYLSDDRGARKITLPMTYFEDTTHSLGGFLATLAQAGQQQLTFDNATYIPVQYLGINSRAGYRSARPLAWEFDLQLLAASPWFRDAMPTTTIPITITVDAGQSFNITYAGSVWAEPVWTYHVPATNAVVINSIQLKNMLAAEFLTVNFLSASAIPASTARDVVIDSGAMTATCLQTGENYDITGSFPKLYGPSGLVNMFSIVSTPASGSTSGCTIGETHSNRWQI